MSDYEIRIYEKGIEDAQAKLGTEVTQDWTDWGQTPAERLKEVYSRPDFDPETRLYAFKDGKLVGFIVSRILPEGDDGIKRGQHDFPLVLEGHEKVVELLLEKAVQTLKEKGAKIIEARTAEGWLGTIELAEKYGYKKARTQFLRIELEVNKAKPKAAEEEFEEFHPEKDKEQIIQLFKDNFNMTDEQAETNFDGIVNPPEGFYSQPVLREAEKIISRGLLYIPKDPKYAAFRPLIPDPRKYFDAYLAKIIKIAKEKGSEVFQIYLGGPTAELLDFYKEYGFELKSRGFIYEKEI